MAARPSLTRYAWLSIGVAIFTFLLKLVAWHLTGSVGLLSDALESLVNLAAGVIALASLTVAARPADEDHSYGHTKVEYFAGGTEGVLIIAAAAGIGWNAVERLFHPQALEGVGPALAVSGVASLANLITARILARVGRQHGSVTLQADSKHLMTDVWTSVAVGFVVAIVSLTGWVWLDPIVGILLAFHIVFTGVKLIHEAMLGLMDTGLPAAEQEKIKAILANAEAEGIPYHALRTRQAGARHFMSVHLLFPDDWTIRQAHDKAEEIEAALCAAIPRLTVLTHLEPISDPASWRDVHLAE